MKLSLSVRSALTDAELFISYNMPPRPWGHWWRRCRSRRTICASISAWLLCTLAPADSLKLPFAAALCRALFRRRIIRKKLPVMANWPTATRNAPQTPELVRSLRKLRFFLELTATES